MANTVYNPFTRRLDITSDSTSGSGSDGTRLKANQLLTPSPNGVVTVFTLPENFDPLSVQIDLNGQIVHNFTVTGSNQITFDDAPYGGSLHALYEVVTVSASDSLYGSGLYGTATYA